MSDRSNLDGKPFDAKVLEAFSYVIVTAVEGGSYTHDDVASWSEYAHADGPSGFQAAVTIVPNKDGPYAGVEGKPQPIRVTADWFARRILEKVLLEFDHKYGMAPGAKPGPLAGKLLPKAVLLLVGDEDAPGDIDVVDAGALLQIAVYGEILYG